MLKRFAPLIAVLVLIFLVWFISYSQMPPKPTVGEIPETEFSTLRAFEHVEEMSRSPHYVGSKAHNIVRNYLVEKLQGMGLEVEIQEAFTLSSKGVLTQPQNILARIPGSGGGKSLVLMSHYDSAPHSSYGASDAASGIATILEGIRAFLAGNEDNLNDIIILFTDAEELGLNGAELFIKEHPWSENVGLALNFEARGSGGSSFMLLETNYGNAKLIREFKKANPAYAATNSLAYSIYKLLPNDTDLTVLREQGSINGFNFAFIDDHFDYHTARDIPANLDIKTLAHQGSYLMPLLDYFKDADLGNLDAEEDLIYFNIPFGEIVSYPYSWIFPMLSIAFVLFLLLMLYGFFTNKLKFKDIYLPAIPFFISLAGGGLIIYLLWKFCLFVYPEYGEVEHGFTYNAYFYISGFVFLTLSLCFLVYDRFKKAERQAGLFLFPLFFWLLVCLLAAIYLKGAAYFVIPAFFGLLQLYFMLKFKRPNLYFMLLLSLPALVILFPFIKTFPVALGLQALFLSAVLSVFLFLLFLPVFGYFRRKKAMALICFIVFNVLFVIAHFKSDFSEERPKPNSLIYLLDADTGTATWNSYDGIPDDWTSPYFEEVNLREFPAEDAFGSKYGSKFTMRSDAPKIGLPQPGINVVRLNPQDSLSKLKSYSVSIVPNRNVNRIELFADRSVNFKDFLVNSKQAEWVQLGSGKFHVFKKRWQQRLLTYHVAEEGMLHLEFTVEEGVNPQFTLYESSFDLLQNTELAVPPRKLNMMPRPFVLNDAVIIKKTISLD